MKTIQLSIQSNEARKILKSNEWIEHGDRYVAILDSVINGSEVRFKLLRPSDVIRPGRVVRWWAATRAFSLTATFAPCAVVLALAVKQGKEIDWIAALSALIGVVFLQVAVNVFNDVEDHYQLIDLPGGIGGSGVIQKGWVSAQSMTRFGWICLILGVMFGLPSLGKMGVIWIGLLSALGVVGYSGWPFKFKYRALGDLVVFLLCGPAISVGFSSAATGSFGGAEILAGLILGSAAVGILHANNLTDIETDSERGARTLAGVLGFNRSKTFLHLVYGFCFLGTVLLAGQSWVIYLTTLLSLVPIWTLLKKVRKASGPWDPSIRLIRIEAAKIHLIYSVLLAVGIILAKASL